MTLQMHIDALLSSVPLAQSACLMGYDGLPVAASSRGEPLAGLSDWLTEYAQTLVCLRRAAIEVPEAGVAQEVVVHATQATVLLRPVHPEYYLAVVQLPEAPPGRARFYMAQCAKNLAGDL